MELCAGAGQIGLLSLTLSASEDSHLVCVDVNPAACNFARQNALSAGLSDQVDVRTGDIEQAVDRDEVFDLVIADPPWVEAEAVATFPNDPVLAIDGGADGLDVARACLRVAEEHLTPGGSMVLQLGSLNQADRLEDELFRRWTPMSVVEVRIEDGGVLVHLRNSDG